MATLREFILAQSTLPTGSTVRQHIQNPGAVDFLVLSNGLEVEMEMACFDIEIAVDLDYEVEITPEPEYEVELETPQYEVEICDG